MDSFANEEIGEIIDLIEEAENDLDDLEIEPTPEDDGYQSDDPRNFGETFVTNREMVGELLMTEENRRFWVITSGFGLAGGTLCGQCAAYSNEPEPGLSFISHKSYQHIEDVGAPKFCGQCEMKLSILVHTKICFYCVSKS